MLVTPLSFSFNNACCPPFLWAGAALGFEGLPGAGSQSWLVSPGPCVLQGLVKVRPRQYCTRCTGKTFLCHLRLSCLQDIRKINSLPNRDTWVKQPGDTPGDTKVDMELLWKLERPLSQGQSRDLPAGASPTGQAGDNQAMVGRGVGWHIQDPMIRGVSLTGQLEAAVRVRRGLGEEGKCHVMGFRGCLPALSPVRSRLK